MLAGVLAKGHVQRAHAMRCAPASGTLPTFLRRRSLHKPYHS